MAYGFTCLIRIPLAQESTLVYCIPEALAQNSQLGINNTYFNLTDLFDFVKINLENFYGGNLTYVRTEDATYIYYTITWSDILVDPSTFTEGLPVSLTVDINNGITSSFFSGAFLPPSTPDLTICDECRNITLEACANSYKIVAGLTPATNYYVTIQDRNNDLYIQEITSDGNGDVTIDATSPEFPAGFWLTESGNKVIKIYSDEALTEIEDITVNDTVYSCVLLNLQYYYTTTT
jgi:hypothetical protein